MLQYFLNTDYRQAYKFLSSHQFLSSCYRFRRFGFDNIRNLMKDKQLTSNSLIFFSQCFKAFDQIKRNPDLIPKILIFIHFLLQTNSKKSSEMFQLMRDQINVVLQNSKNIYQQNKKVSNNHSCCVIELDQKQNNDNGSKNTSPSIEIQILSRSNCSSAWSLDKFQHEPNKLIKNRKDCERNFQINSGKQFLCENLIQPYSIYLLKKCIEEQNKNEQEKKTKKVDDLSLNSLPLNNSLQVIIIWKQINTLKQILRITQSITTLGRYYKQKYLTTILNVVQILHQDIHKSYKKISDNIKVILENMKSQQKQNILRQKQKQEKQNRIEIKVNLNKSINIRKQKVKIEKQNHYQKQQITHIFKQIGQINDNLIFMYWGKYIVTELSALGLKIPELLKVQNSEYDDIIDKIQKQEKQKERKLRKFQILKQSRSKSKSEINIKNGTHNKSKLKIKNLEKTLRNFDNESVIYNHYQTLTPNRIPRCSLKNTFRKKSEQIKPDFRLYNQGIAQCEEKEIQ